MRMASGLGYKRPFDLMVLAMGHLLLFPVFLTLWLVIPFAVWLGDRGPVLYRQTRYGKGGQEFTFLKFRTMSVGGEVEGLITGHNDHRVTKVGRVLRRTALDELPQVINILRGEMSFVGPRPLPIAMHDQAARTVPRFPERLRIIPGLTGVAQLYLPRHCHPRRRVRYDLLYAKKASLWLDIRLMLRAVWNTVTGAWGMGRRTTRASAELESGPAGEG